MAKAYAPRDNTTYRSAAAAQLLDMDDRFSIFRKERTVLDLGCFAGGWLEVARERCLAGTSGSRVVGVDTVVMDPLPDVEFVQGSVTDKKLWPRLLADVPEKFDIVLSDVSRPRVELRKEDHMSSTELGLAACEGAELVLKPGGWLLLKHYYGSLTPLIRTYLHTRYERVRAVRPEGSGFREMCFVCVGFKEGALASEVPVQTMRLKHEAVATPGAGREDAFRVKKSKKPEKIGMKPLEGPAPKR